MLLKHSFQIRLPATPGSGGWTHPALLLFPPGAQVNFDPKDPALHPQKLQSQ